ncbi:M61 family metallopeptidase [Pseudoalteromonas sp. SR44-5]|uniref:M61 family metallopeptidase n=1 Tax=Pseudoalteromonas TaxID=53246 RepID=UPI0016013E4D|nr:MULTISPECIES: PDZ domain-containing protein [unclassified Pseudoalteromonas]MBB1342244.1 M61 family metallopeptidase [Pseudoalteromonas sp. SR45-6]MBB1367502.1 M61 family metallopeptidase [Pseudoalteromonas sp. SR44-5]MBB1417534.1 M61 family metallopeptidase [Pseudoalteromonas sp. SG44-1]MBB1423097.1 M61 family metallopeptidase [Pseudoalteromonas sp. SG43-7]MBB1434661.1 M61 family metallopeptidase [Pseudoalteromonas sp. SG43-6]
MKKFLALSVLAALSHSAWADVNYSLAVTQPEHHLGNVSVEFPQTAQAHLDVKLPAWRTGRYEILNLANGVRFFEATGDNGKALKWEKIDASTWRVHLDKPTEVKIDYQVYANELGKRARHIDDSHAFIDASGFFMFSESFRQEPVTVKLDVPKAWRSVSGMDNAGSKHSFKAADYDVLVDSPIETGINELHKFAVDGRDYELVIWGKGNYDVEQMLEDLKKLVATGNIIWDAYPYQRYVFMVHATSGAGGATEHLNSTIIQRPRDRFGSREDYLAFISTAAHEFIHTWNVKAYRPEGLVPYDYTHINYDKLLWIAEGSTSYFEDHLMVRSGIATTDEFLNVLTKTVNRHLSSPGREVQSATETSFDKWINQGGDHARNYSTNIYSEGSLISMALDIDLLENSQGKQSYRDIHRALYNQYKMPHGFTATDVKTILKQLTGRDYSQWWANNVDAPADIDFDALFKKVGLMLERPKDAKAVASVDAMAKNTGELLTLTHVRRDGAAWQAGLTSDDKIVAINKKHVGKDLKSSLETFKAGDKVTIDFIRRDALQSTTITLAQSFDKDKKLVADKQATAQQMALFKAWMGVEHPNLVKK